jgi:uncharacterized membrane protein YfcA
MTFVLLAVAAFAAGVINSVAGGGSFLTFPSLVFAGLPAVAANASSTVALVPAAFASGYSYREDIRGLHERGLRLWFLIAIVGGGLGAYLLLVTSDRTFRQIAPWLLAFATLLFAFGNQVSTALRGKLHGSQAFLWLLLFPISVYGGYFGGGIGIMILAAFRLYGLTDLHAMNGVKTLLSATLNALAAALFIIAHRVYWFPTLVMMVAGILGGYAGPMLARRMKPGVLRAIIIAVGVVMTCWFFYTAPR